MDDILIGKTLGNYKIITKLGEGGMGTVYKAMQPSLNRYVAIKTLLMQYTLDVDFLNRFKREALATAALQHPNIVHIYDIAQEGGIYYIAMEYVDGGTLKSLLEKARLGLRSVLNIVTQVCSALDAAHGQGIVHRDIKPSNILLSRDGRALLTDFGLAKVSDTAVQLTTTGAVMGTPKYMSPEQAQGHELDYRSDLYSLGVVLYEMVTGQAPFDSPSPLAILHDHVYATPPPPSDLNASLPQTLDEPILKALAKKPEERYQRAKEMVMALRTAMKAATMKLKEEEEEAVEKKVPGTLEVPGTYQPSAPTMTPFSFSNQVVHSLEELVQLCDQRWDFALTYLYQGRFESWLAANGRDNLATLAADIRLRGGNRDIGLEEFLQATGLAGQPTLIISPSPPIDLGTLMKGESRTIELVLSSSRGHLSGPISSGGWISVAPDHFTCVPGEVQTVRVTVDTSNLATQQTHQGTITIGPVGVPVSVCLPEMPPKLAVSTTTLDFGALPAGQEDSRSFFIGNEGDGLLSGDISTNRKWLTVQPASFEGEQQVTVTVKTSGLRRESVHKGRLQLDSNGGGALVEVTVKVVTSSLDRLGKRVGVIVTMVIWGSISGLGTGFVVSLLHKAATGMRIRDALIGLATGAAFGFILGFMEGIKNVQSGMLSGVFVGPIMGAVVGAVVRAVHAQQVGDAALVPAGIGALTGAFLGAMTGAVAGLFLGAIVGLVRGAD